MSFSIFPFCRFSWQNEMVKLANWQNEKCLCRFSHSAGRMKILMVKLEIWQNEQNENVFVDFPILPILLAE